MDEDRIQYECFYDRYGTGGSVVRRQSGATVFAGPVRECWKLCDELNNAWQRGWDQGWADHKEVVSHYPSQATS